MKQYLIGIAVIVVLLLVVSGGSLQDVFTPSATLAPVTCPSGQQAVTIYDAQLCGTNTELSNEGGAGICLSYTCPVSISGEAVAFCTAGVKNFVQGGYTVQPVKLNPGQSINFPTYCSQDPNGQTYVIGYTLWRNSTLSCQTCVTAPHANECTPGTVTCGSGAEIKTCVIGNAAKPYYHYEIYDYCNSGATCLNNINGVTCSQPCSNDVQCARYQYCDSSIHSCVTQKADGSSCENDNQCLSEACVSELFGKACRTVTGKSPGTCQIQDIKTSGDCLACAGVWKDEQGLFGRGLAGLFGGEIRAPTCDLNQGFNFDKFPTIIIGSVILGFIVIGGLALLGLLFVPLGLVLRKYKVYSMRGFITGVVLIAFISAIIFTGLTLQAASLVGI